MLKNWNWLLLLQKGCFLFIPSNTIRAFTQWTVHQELFKNFLILSFLALIDLISDKFSKLKIADYDPV